MKLKSVIIEGFRSIKKMEISFDRNGHKILVGKNESGKSNILKALNLLSSPEVFKGEDEKELYSSPSVVIFIFSLEENEINKIKKEFCQKFSSKSQTLLTNNLTIEQFAEKYSQFIACEAYCGENKKCWNIWEILPKNLHIKENWYLLDKNFFNHHESRKIINSMSYINDSLIKSFTEEEKTKIKQYLSPITLQGIYRELNSIMQNLIIPNDNYCFPVINWRYNEKEHDLPHSVDRNTFANSPNSCMPLKNMFLLAGIEEENINKEISERKSKGFNSFKNLLNKVNKETNEYIKKIWKEFIDVELELRSDGENIVIGIKDSENSFNFQQRSDGFRRLISFLLLMSTEDHTSQKAQKLILIDEPETGLHPSSAKDLRDKLIELGKNNLVVYATHSISMIDTENIENNLIVSRTKENTIIETAKENGISPAENIYQAIGYSIYEELKQVNILLEGYTDKKIIKLFMGDKCWDDFGICYTGGVKDIQTVISILDLGNRKYFVLSDSDDMAKDKKKRMGNPDYWYTYKDLESTAITVEDFYKKEFFIKTVNIVLKKYGMNNINIEMPGDDRIEVIKKFFHKEQEQFLTQKAKEKTINLSKLITEIVNKIKSQCIDNFTKQNLDQEKIKGILKKLSEKINPT